MKKIVEKKTLLKRMFFTNNCVESLNSTINSYLNKGRISIDKFGDILQIICHK